jgi:chromosome segregation ATPase
VKQPSNNSAEVDALRKTIALKTDRESALRDQLRAITAAVRSTENERAALRQPKRRRTITEKATSFLPNAAHDQYQAKVAELTERITAKLAEAIPLNSELDRVTAALVDARKKLGEIEAAADSARRQWAAEAVRIASETAPSRQAFLDARNKLQNLRQKLAAVEHELHTRLTTAAPAETPAGRAAALLETGNLPAVKSQTGTVQGLVSDSRAIASAIALQQKVVRKLQSQLAREVYDGLRGPLHSVVASMAEGIEQARRAAVDSLALQTAYTVLVGEPLPQIRFAGLPLPSDAADAFTMWRDAAHVAGLL